MFILRCDGIHPMCMTGHMILLLGIRSQIIPYLPVQGAPGIMIPDSPYTNKLKPGCPQSADCQGMGLNQNLELILV